MAHTRTSALGPAAQPVAVPRDFDNAFVAEAAGRVELPLHVRSGEPPITYDLDDRGDRARVYEQVLREGTEDDVRFFVEASLLLELLDELVLPAAVRRASADWIRQHRGAG